MDLREERYEDYDKNTDGGEIKEAETIKDLQVGDIVEDLLAVVSDITVRTVRNGDILTSLLLRDASGTLPAVMWNNPPKLKTGSIVEVTGVVGWFNDSLQLSIDSIEEVKLTNEMLPKLYPKSLYPIDFLKTRIRGLRGTISDEHLRKLVAIITDLDDFYIAPAGKRLHHAYIGGLAEHSCAVAEIVNNAIVLYPDVNKDAAIAGALLHDIGKIRELMNDTILGNYTDEGRLLSHVYIGAEMVRTISDKNNLQLPLNDIIHIILSHHGDSEKGALVKPATLEANIVHLADYMDSTMGIVNLMYNDTNNEWAHDPVVNKSLRTNIVNNGQE